MSHPFYNPYASGNHNPTQGQYGVPNPPTERDPRGASSYLGPGSRFSAFGASPVIPENSGQPGSASLNYRPEPGRAMRDEDAKSSIDMHIGRAREGVRPPSNQLHQPMDQGTRFTSTQREDFRPPGASYTMTSASASLGHKHEVDIGSGSSNLNYIRPPGGSILKSSSALSNYANIPDARFSNPDERGRDMQTIPGLGDYDRPASDKPASSTEPFQPMYTYESASSILLQFGLEKEDLEHLISYPEDQITPANLPFILRQIRLQKDKNAATAAQSKPYLESRPSRTMGSGGAMEKTSSAVLQPSNVIDYGHTSKYTAGVADDAGMNIDRDNSGGSGNVFLMDTDERRYREPKSTPEFKSSVLGSSKEQMRSSTSLSSMYGSVLRPVDSPSSDQTKPWQVKPQQTFQEILNSFSQLRSDKTALKSEGSKLVPLNQQEVHRQSTTSKAQPPSSQTHGTHPSQPGLLQIGGKTPGQRPTAPVKTHQASQQQPMEQKQPVKKAPSQSTKQPVQKQPVQKQPVQKQQQSKKQMQQHQKHPAPQKGQVASAGVSARPMKPAASKGPQKNKAAASKDQPTPEMMFDYAAASPRIFPHTCVLCSKECTDMKAGLRFSLYDITKGSSPSPRIGSPTRTAAFTWRAAHASENNILSGMAGLHFSRGLPVKMPRPRARPLPRKPGMEAAPVPNHSAPFGVVAQREDGINAGADPGLQRALSSAAGTTVPPLPAIGHSPERRSSPRRKDDRQSSPRRTRDRRSPLKRSNESWSPQRRVDNRRSPLRKGDAARSPLRRSSDSRSPTRRVDNRWFDSRRSPLRRVGGRRSPLRRSAESSSPPRRSLDRRPSREGSSDQRKGPNSAESLAKKLLETSAVQSLSNKSDLETVVKTLAPALLAELAKMTTPAAASSASSSSLKGGKRPLPAFSTRRKKLSSSASSSPSSSSTAKMKRSATIPSRAKSLLKSEVRLRGIHEGISHDDVVTAMEHFGKTKSVTLYRSKLEAIARFEKEEDANRLKILQVLDVKGAKVTVVEEKAAVKKQTKTPLKKPTKTTASWKVLLPTPKIPPLIPLSSPGPYQSKFVSTKARAKNSAKAMKTANKAQVLVSKAKNVSTKVVAKNVKTAKLPVKEGEKTAAAKQETSPPENQPVAADSKEKVVPESAATSGEGVGVKEVDESANKTAGEAAEAPSTGGAVLVSQAATGESVPSKSADSDNQPLGESLKRNQPEAKVAESSEVHKDTAESGKASPPTVVKLQGIGSALSHSDVLAAVKHFGKTKSVILVRARLEAVVIFEKEEDAKKLKSVKSLNVNGTEITVVPEKESISKEEKTPPLSASTSAPSTLKPAKEDVKAPAAKDANTPTKPTADDQSHGEKSKPQEANVKVEESPQDVSEDAAQAAVRANVAVVKLEEDAADGDEGEPMEIEVSGVKDEGPESGADSSVESTVTLGGGAETQTTQEERTQVESTSADDVSIEVQPAVKTEPVAAASKQSVTGLTIGEMLEKRLFPKHINAWLPDYSCQNLPYGCIHVLISGLPMHCPGVYTETDVANLLRPFGFKRKEDNLFVFAQSRMAFAMMPTVANVLHLTRTSAKRGVFFRGTRLVCQVIKMRYPLTAAQFYTNLKKLLRCSTSGEVERSVLIRNISQRDIRELREGLKRFGPVTNFTPLLNKLFVEFESVTDVDRFEGWYGGVNKKCGNKVVKLKGPSTSCEALRHSVQEFEVEGDFGIIYEPPPRMYAEAASADDAAMTDGTEEASAQRAGETEADTTEGAAEAGTASSRSEASEEPPDLGDLEVKVESAGAGLQEETRIRQTPAAASSEGVSSSECEASDSVPGAAVKGPGVQLKDPEDSDTVSTAQEAKSQVVTLAAARGANEAASEHEDELVELGAPGDTEQTGPSSSRDTGTEDAAVEAETETTTKESTQTDSTPTRESSPSVGRVSAAACTEVVPPSTSEAAAAASRPPPSSPSSTRLTVGEMLESYLFANDIHTLQSPYVSPLAFNQQLLIRGLPPYHDGCYTEDDVADLLFPFGFRHKQDKLYVIPQTRMAFATMPSLASVYDVLKVHRKSGLYFREKRLSVQIVRHRYQMKLFQFYRFLKTLMKCSTPDEAQRTILIRNISPSEIRELRDALKEFGPLTNFMPLLNKLFVEFESVEDTDRFAGWYSEVLQIPGQDVIRLKKRGPTTTQPHAASAKGAKKTFGEKFENYLSRKKIGSLKCKPGTTPKMLISLLPAYGEGSYTESEVIELLAPFGYQHKDHNIYVFPQASLAFVLMPTAGDVSEAIRATRGQHVTFKESELYFSALDDTVSMRPYWFYQSLMARLGYCVTEDRDAVIFIRGISPSESRQLRDALAKMGSVRNFLPLLNKVFVEFQSACDADWLGVWYSLLRRAPGYRIQRLKIPQGTSGPPSPVVPKESLLDNKDLIDGVALPSVKVSVPPFSTSPFWISLRHSPFVFPTISPWFVIPEYRTVKNLTDIETAGRQGSMCPTIMLTGLPEGNYRHEDVARLVWPHFPKQTLHSLYYNVTVLPLQRRAFVFFSDWTTCCDFVQAHVAKRVSLKGRVLGVHFVLQNMYPESSEETMYRSLMKWSNAGVPDPTSLEERLLCVEVSEVSLDVITLVVEMVASITSFANFMPLANRICIEMNDSSSVSLVVDKYKDPAPNVFTEDPAWSKVKNFEPLDCLTQRLRDSADVTINLDEPDAGAGKVESPDIDEDMLKAITVTLGENRLVQKSRSQSVEKKGQDDFTEDLVSTDAYLFDEEQFNAEDFVTVDEVYDDGEDSSVEPRPDERPSRERSERQSSGGSSSHRRTQTKSSRDDKSAPSSSSSRSNKSSRSSHSSKPTKSSAKPSSSSVASRASSLPPPAGTLTSPASGKKPKQSATKSTLKSSSSQREKVVTPAEGSVEPEQVGEGAGGAAEGAVAKSDHRVSAEGTAAKCAESETEIDPPQEQERGLDLNQSPNPEVDLETKKKQKKSEEDEKHPEEVAGGSYQAADSPDGQTDEQMEDCGQDGRSAPQTTVSEGGQVGDGGGVTRPGGIDEGVRETDTTDKCLQSEIQERDGKQDSRDPDSDGTDQEAFEILDSIDDQTEVEDEGEERAQIPEGDDGPVEDGDEAYEVIDSVGDQPPTTESELKQQRPRRGAGRSASREDDGPLRSSGPTSKAAEESPKKQERTVRVPEARIDTDSAAEEMLFQVVDSVEEEHVEEAASRESSGRRRSTRGKKDAAVEAFEILDSVENETAGEEPPVTRRSTRGKRGRTTEDASSETTQGEDAPTGRRQTASRESRSREKTPKREENAPPKEAKRVRREGEPSEEVATYEVLDSVEDEVLDEQPAPRAKGKRGRPKKQVKAAKKDGGTSEKVVKDAADEEEATTYRILDSVEDESGDGPPPPPPSDQSGIKGEEDVSKDDAKRGQDGTSLEGSTKKEEEEEEEEEPVFQIVDSLEDDQVQDEVATADASDGTKTGDETPRGEEDATLLEASTKSVPEEESLLQSPDGADPGTPLVKSRGDTAALEREIQQKPPEKEVTAASALVSLDEVSDEEEDYPDDREEEEELRKRQAAAKEKRFPKEQEARGGREQERRSRGGGGGGGGDGRRSRRGKEREDEKAEVDGQEMVTLDEVGADEAKDETPPEGRESEEEEAQGLVTLDEFVDEEAEPIKLEARPLSQEDESVDDLNQEALVTLDEACCDEDEKPAEETLASSKRKHDGDAEEGMNFVIVDEVKDEEKVETPRTRGRAKKRARLTPVRKSTRGKQASSHQEEKEAVDEEPPSSSNDADSSKPPGVGELKAQEAAEEEAGVDEASARPKDETLERRAERGEEEEEEESRTDSKDVGKERRDADGPEAKRPRSQSPSVPADFKLPEVKPDHPLGEEFVLPGFFCSLCSIFYQHESTAKELHCSSQTHFNNLQKHYRQLHQTAGSSTQ